MVQDSHRLGQVPRAPSGDRALPYNLEAEESLLGAMLLSKDAIVAASELQVSSEDFYKPVHGHIFDAITSLYSAGEPADPVTVAEELRRAGLLGDIGGQGLLVSLQVRTPATSSAARYARIVSEHAQMRRLHAVAGRIADLAVSHPRDVGAAIEEALGLVDGVSAGSTRAVAGGLVIEDVAAVVARVDAMAPPSFLARPVWPVGAYGVIGAENKAGKTWAALDLAVAVGAEGRWLGSYQCEAPGPVLVFLGEGDERKMTRRLRAICRWNSVELEELPLRLSFRVPKLSRDGHLAIIRAELRARPARLVIVDPLYLAATGASSSNLIEMGAMLEPLQHICQDAGATLVIVHHWNQTGRGAGRERFSGAGAAEWGRVTASAAVESRTTQADASSDVVLAWQFVGDETSDAVLRLRRVVRAKDPADLTSPLTYELEVLDPEAPSTEGDAMASEKPAVRRTWQALRESPGPATVSALGDHLAKTGTPLQRRTIQDALSHLRELGLAKDEVATGAGPAPRWSVQDNPNSAPRSPARPDDDTHACIGPEPPKERTHGGALGRLFEGAEK